MDAEALQLLRAMADYLRGIRRTLERGHHDPDADAAPLLRAIKAHVEHRVFCAADLVIHAALPEAMELRTAIVETVGALSARRIGKYFKSIEGRELHGVTIVRCSADRDGITWRAEGEFREFLSRKLTSVIADIAHWRDSDHHLKEYRLNVSPTIQLLMEITKRSAAPLTFWLIAKHKGDFKKAAEEAKSRGRPDIAQPLMAAIDVADTTTTGWAAELAPLAAVLANWVKSLSATTLYGRLPFLRVLFQARTMRPRI